MIQRALTHYPRRDPITRVPGQVRWERGICFEDMRISGADEPGIRIRV